MNIMNRRGPNIDPCGMPLKTSAQQENIPLTFTLCFLLVRKFLIQSIML